MIEGNTLMAPHGLVVCPEMPDEAAVGLSKLTIRKNTIVVANIAVRSSTTLATDAVRGDVNDDRGTGPSGVHDNLDGFWIVCRGQPAVRCWLPVAHIHGFLQGIIKRADSVMHRPSALAAFPLDAEGPIGYMNFEP